MDVDLALTLGRPCSIAPGLETFEVTGPDSAVRFVAGQTEGAKEEYSTGFLSPRAPITLPDEIKLLAGIPLELLLYECFPHSCLILRFHVNPSLQRTNAAQSAR